MLKGRFIRILLGIASAVGIGNLWRFPYVALNYGLEFILAYLFVLIPSSYFILLESNLSRVKVPKFYLSLIVLGSLAITLYYPLLTAETLTVSFHIPLEFSLVLTLSLSITASVLGLKEGLERISKTLVPLLFLFLTVAFLGSLDRLSLPSFDWANLLSFKLWIDAFGQAFFSLSLGMGFFLLLSRKTGPLSKGEVLAVALGDTLAALLAYALTLSYAPSGFLAGFEALLEALPAGIRELFFLSLFFAAITSLVSMLWVVKEALGIPFVFLSALSFTLLLFPHALPLVDSLASKILLPFSVALVGHLSVKNGLADPAFVYPVILFLLLSVFLGGGA